MEIILKTMIASVVLLIMLDFEHYKTEVLKYRSTVDPW